MRKAGSPTGNREGYTLLEILVTVAVLGVGLMFILPAFVRSGTALSYLSSRHYADGIAENLFTDAELSLRRENHLTQFPADGSVEVAGVTYRYTLEALPQDKKGFLYDLKARVEWKDSKSNSITRTATVCRL